MAKLKRYAQQHGTSLSRLVEDYLAAVSGHPSPPGSPILRSIRGCLKKGRTADYAKHLATKYR